MSWAAACPRCHRPFHHALDDAGTPSELVCTPSCGVSVRLVDGLWDALLPQRRPVVDRFLADYHVVRRAEGRGSTDPAYYRALPDTVATDPLAWQWSMRARTWRHVARRLVPGWPAGAKVVDLGAGCGWLSNRLASLGHQPIAVDVSDDGLDGLGAARHYERRWPLVRAEFDHLPVADAEADVVVFNASFHYSVDARVTLAEALRVLRPSGAVVVLDTPVYRHERSGRQMAAERHADFERRFGTRSDSMPSIEYLTDDGIAELGTALGLRWERSVPWYGWRWAARPLVAKLRQRREPSRFVVLVGRRA